MQKELSFHLILVCGGSASGKSTVLENLKNRFSASEICFISMDDYYKPIEYQHQDDLGVYNFDLPGSLDIDSLVEVLTQLSEGKKVDRNEYTFNHPDKVPGIRHYFPAPVIIVEGLFSFWFDVLRSFSHYKVFIDSDQDVCYQRRKQRDIEVRGIPEPVFEHQWKNHVIPAYKQFVDPYSGLADLVIENTYDYKSGVAMLEQHIREVLSS